MPFRFIGALTRNIRWFISWPLRILLSVSFVGIVVGAILVFLYGTISNRYDISEVKSNIPERTVILDRKTGPSAPCTERTADAFPFRKFLPFL